MRFSIVASALALVGFAAAGAHVPPPPTFQLTQDDANTIVAKYKSILENATYNGQTPYETAQQVIAVDYVEKSDSILSIISKNNTLGDGAAATATSRDQWFSGVTANPTVNIETHDIFVAGNAAVLWYWTFPNVGISRYPCKGFNLLRVDEDYQIYEADIEFNSIAWAVDIFQLQQYCS